VAGRSDRNAHPPSDTVPGKGSYSPQAIWPLLTTITSLKTNQWLDVEPVPLGTLPSLPVHTLRWRYITNICKTIREHFPANATRFFLCRLFTVLQYYKK